MTSDERQYKKMVGMPVSRLVNILALPTIVSMLVSAVYNTADTFFVSNINTSAGAAVGVVFSLMAIIQAIGFTLGMGSGSWISRLLGKKEVDKARRVSVTGFASAIVIGGFIAALGSIFIRPLMSTLGATPTSLAYAVDYGKWVLLAAPIMAGSFVLNNILRSEGKATFSMIGIATGGVLNIALDPLLIYSLGMGAEGAGLATAISQTISFCILLVPFVSGKTITALNPRRFGGFGMLMGIVRNGLPSLCRQGLASVATILMNMQAKKYGMAEIQNLEIAGELITGGDIAVNAMSVVNKIFHMIFSISIGFSQGYQPVCGYNYGAKRYDRVYKAYLYILTVCTVLLTVLSGLCFAFAPQIMRLFNSQTDLVIKVGSSALRAQCVALPLIATSVVCNVTYQTIGQPWISTLLSSARQGLFFVPLIYLLPMAFGLKGVEYTQAIADLLSFLLVLPFAISFLRKMKRASSDIEVSDISVKSDS